jgi:hypothetical protein
MISLDIVIYAINLMQVVFHPVVPVGRLVKNWERDSCVKKENNTQNNTKTQNTQHKKQKYKENQT